MLEDYSQSMTTIGSCTMIWASNWDQLDAIIQVIDLPCDYSLIGHAFVSFCWMSSKGEVLKLFKLCTYIICVGLCGVQNVFLRPSQKQISRQM